MNTKNERVLRLPLKTKWLNGQYQVFTHRDQVGLVKLVKILLCENGEYLMRLKEIAFVAVILFHTCENKSNTSGTKLPVLRPLQ